MTPGRAPGRWLRTGSALLSLLPSRADLQAARRQPLKDLLAGLTVAVVALPLALGFGVASGAGAAAGLVTAVVAGAVAAVFGGSNLQVSGPTGAMTVVLVPIIAEFGTRGVLTVGLLAGLLLVGAGLLRIGRYIRLVPAPVVEGFTVGIAAVIFLQQVPAALGVHSEPGNVVALAARALTRSAAHPDWTTIGLATGVVVTILAGSRWRPGIPFSLPAVVVATVLADAAHWDIPRIGALPSTLPAPTVGFIQWDALPALVLPAVAVATLAALESLLSATVADGMSVDSRHDPDRELFGQGLANLAAPLFGGVPATAAIARTAVNVRSGARSRVAALSHAVILAAIMLAAGPVVAEIPLAALAGVLMATAVRMVGLGTVAVFWRASRADGLVLAVTAALTLAVDVVTAVVIGLVAAMIAALRAIARSASVRTETFEGSPSPPEADLLAEHIVVYRLDGPLFFAVAHRFLLDIADPAQVVVLRLSHVTALDTTGGLVLRDLVDRLETGGSTVYLSGVRAEQERTLTAVGLLPRLRTAHRCFDTTPEAIAAARNHVEATGPPASKARKTTQATALSTLTSAHEETQHSSRPAAYVIQEENS